MKCYPMHVFQKLDEAAIQQGISASTLMANAAKGVYEVLIQKAYGKRLLIVCGSGNNGGDGLALAALYHASFDHVMVLYVASQIPRSVEAMQYYQTCVDLQLLVHGDYQDIKTLAKDYDVMIDALFGTGLSRPLQEPYIQIIDTMNQSRTKLVAIDIPSGIHGDVGQVMGQAIKADCTVSFVGQKVGTMLYPGYEYAGEVIIKDIGIPMALLDTMQPTFIQIDEACLKQLLPKRKAHSHKGTYGRLLGIGGEQTMGGALLMAGEAVLRSGAGTCTLAVPASIQPQVCLYLPELMSIPLSQKGTSIDEAALFWISKHLDEYDVVFCGCGSGREAIIASLVSKLLLTDQPCVLDGDALYALREQRQRLSKRKHLIVTPHVKEMTYLIDMSIDEIIHHPLQAADMFCEQYPDVVLVLKSERPLIAYQKQRFLCTQGNHALAKGGSGDVLCGMIASHYAQTKDALTGAILGCGLHALCAQQAVQNRDARSILPHELCNYLDEVLKKLV